VGLKTTKGRWSTAGVVPLSTTLDTVGVMTRTVEDLRLVFDVIDGPAQHVVGPAELCSLHFARCDRLLFDDCSAGVVEAVDDALGELTGAGVRIDSLDLPELEPTWELFRQGGPVSFEAYHFLSTELPDWLDSLDPNVRARIGEVAQRPAHEYLARLRAVEQRSASVAERLRAVDVLVSPTVANTPPRLADIATAQRYGPQNLLSLRNTSMASYLGLCAITLPVGLDAAGMPVGLQLMARPNTERRLLALAHACEKRLGTARQQLGTPPRCVSADGAHGL
jgi:aspartyl-tRNA(Asn)/glutamyl-tRNA(Gln) amidotransferase subunit A